jgi:hypothetical protein
MIRTRALVLAGIATVGLSPAGCGKSGNYNKSAKNPSKPAVAAPQHGPDTGASALRADLAALLTDHVYLAGVAIETGLTSSLHSAAFKAAADTLDKNSVALSKAIGSIYGTSAARKFLTIWRAHIGFFIDYTKAKAAGDAQAAQAAVRRLDGYRQAFGAFMASVDPNLAKDAVAEELKPHVASVLATIDAAVAKSPATVETLHMAADHMPGTAKFLAAGIAKQLPDKFTGLATGPSADLRSTLTSLLEDHVYLAGVAVATGAAAGMGSPAFQAAAGALDENSVALSQAFGSVYGDKGAKQFLALWRKHIGFFVDYAKAESRHNAQGARAALANLDGYRRAFGTFIASANPNLPKEAVADALKPHIETLAAAIRAAVKKSPTTFERLQAAAAHMRVTADILAVGIVKQFPDRFAA